MNIEKAVYLLFCLFLSAQLFAQSYQKTESGIKTTTQSMQVEINFTAQHSPGFESSRSSFGSDETPEKTDLKIRLKLSSECN